ncbi:hypothetical protein BJY01DRAFT_234667 [Aspergillus pseudoustus]|uniref:Tetratricopeptide repeat-domain-containing protein n=1 Tax=Aspergillus pseudoustus TaxID=1810923 RepID=A0ABR4K2E1_9EURO
MAEFYPLRQIRYFFNQAIIRERKGQWDDSIEHLLTALRVCDRHLGPTHCQTHRAQTMLASNYRQKGRYEEAEKLDREALAGRQQILGEDHVDTIMSCKNLALDLKGQGRYDEAIELEEHTMEFVVKEQGEEGLDAMNCMNNLANTCAKAGRYEDAAELRGKVLKGRTRVLGPNHHLTIASQDLLGTDLRSLGQIEKAIQLQENAVDTARYSLSETHGITARCSIDLAATYEAEGTDKGIACAISVLEQAFWSFELRGGLEDTLLTVALKNNLAIAYAKHGRFKDARPLLLSCYEWNKAHLGLDDSTTQQASANLMWLLEQMGELVRGPAISN